MLRVVVRAFLDRTVLRDVFVSTQLTSLELNGLAPATDGPGHALVHGEDFHPPPHGLDVAAIDIVPVFANHGLGLIGRCRYGKGQSVRVVGVEVLENKQLQWLQALANDGAAVTAQVIGFVMAHGRGFMGLGVVAFTT